MLPPPQDVNGLIDSGCGLTSVSAASLEEEPRRSASSREGRGWKFDVNPSEEVDDLQQLCLADDLQCFHRY